jgi:hypothetical protein
MESKLDDSIILKKLMRRYIIAFVSILVLIIVRQYIIQVNIEQNTYASSLVNVSGKQRMLSQQISKDVYALYF